MAQGLTVVDLRHVGRGDFEFVGGKAANLGELIQAKLPVPPGFVITTAAYTEFLRASRLAAKIKKMMVGLDPENTRQLQKTAREIQYLLIHAPLPVSLRQAIRAQYEALRGTVRGQLAVAVRPSLTADDLPDAQFVGQLETYLQVVGVEGVIRAVQHVWASLFEPQAVYYRMIKGCDHFRIHMAVIVQAMVEAATAGVMMTENPLSGRRDEIIIEAAFGLGEAVVLGLLTPDRYVVSKADEKIIDRTVQPQLWEIVRESVRGSGTRHRRIPRDRQRRQKLADGAILELARSGRAIERHFGAPQLVEWVVTEAGQVTFVESAPLEIQEQIVPVQVDQAATEQTLLVRGLGASLGVASGPVRIIHKPSQLAGIRDGEILVTEMTHPSYLPALRRAAAVVTDAGGLTSHAVVITRELGLPCVVGAGTATTQLKTGVVVTVDGYTGGIYKGKAVLPNVFDVSHPHQRGNGPFEQPITATKIYLNLSEPDRASEFAQLPVDGVGLLRAEFMIANLGVHPRYLLKERKDHLLVRKLTDGIRTIAQAFAPRPVIYRSTDFKTNEYRSLTGGAKVEPREENPMLGYRGALRYLREPDIFQLELVALKTVRDSYDLRNVWLMLPFIRTVEECKAVRAMVETAGLLRESDFKLWMMAEVPSNVLLLDAFLDVGIDGVSIGSNDLTQLLLGIDRDNARLVSQFDERDPAVIGAMTHVVQVCRRRNIPVSICGEASTYPEVAESLIVAGITSLSVSPDAAIATRQLAASIERRLLLDRLTKTAHGDAHPRWG